jgi:hypothetical protein
MKKADIRFTVEGRGEFPLDMLRYDRCFPRTGEDADMMLRQPEHLRSTRCVTLVALARDNRFWQPTEGRWLSFGWSVIEVHAMVE